MYQRTEEPSLEFVLSLARQLRPVDQAKLLGHLASMIEVALQEAESNAISPSHRPGLIRRFLAEFDSPPVSSRATAKRARHTVDEFPSPHKEIMATGVRFDGPVLQVDLEDGRMISLDVNKAPWLNWLARATPTQRRKGYIEPNGHAIYWDALDNGIEIRHLLSINSLV